MITATKWSVLQILGCWWISTNEQLTLASSTSFPLAEGQDLNLATAKHEHYFSLTGLCQNHVCVAGGATCCLSHILLWFNSQADVLMLYYFDWIVPAMFAISVQFLGLGLGLREILVDYFWVLIFPPFVNNHGLMVSKLFIQIFSEPFAA